MNTPSHFLMTAALGKALPRVPIQRQAFLWGAIAPDVPLWFLTFAGIIYYRGFLGWSMADTFRIMFDQLYFQNPFWLGLHNFLHAPIVLVFGLVLVWNKRANIGSVQRWLFWFLIACLLHSWVDVFTHADDGPLLFFPFNWSIRFDSPISYWDPRHYGNWFQPFEMALDSFCILYLLSRQLRCFVYRFNLRGENSKNKRSS